MNMMNEFITKCVSQEFTTLPVNDVIDKEKVKIRMYISQIFSKIQKQLNNHSLADNGQSFTVSIKRPEYNNILIEIQKILKDKGYSSNITYAGIYCNICISFV